MFLSVWVAYCEMVTARAVQGTAIDNENDRREPRRWAAEIRGEPDQAQVVARIAGHPGLPEWGVSALYFLRSGLFGTGPLHPLAQIIAPHGREGRVFLRIFWRITPRFLVIDAN